MSIDSSLRKAAKLAKAGNRAGAAALYREVLVNFPGNTTAKKGLAALSVPMVRPGPGTPARKARPAGGPAPAPQQMAALERLMQRGDARAVVAEGQRLALLFARAPGLFNLLGQARSQLGQHEAALADYERVIELDPGFAGAYANRANALILLGRHAEAEAAARDAIARAPNLAPAHLFLGHALVNSDRARDALAPLAKAVRLAPGFAQAHIALGNAHAALREHAQALDAFEAARAIDPENASIFNNIGNALLNLNRIEEGFAALERASQLAPRNTLLLANQARRLRDLGHTPQAAAIAERIVALSPDSSEAWGMVGRLRHEMGDRTGALAAFDKAIARAPQDFHAIGFRGQIAPLPLDHPDLARLVTVAEADAGGGPAGATALPVSDRIMVNLALFKAYDKADRPADAIACLARANALRQSAEPYDFEAQSAVLARLKAAFAEGVTPLGEADRAAIALPARPVFIVGMPRSGTSLVEQILASHSQVHGAGELTTIATALDRLGWHPGGAARRFDAATLREIRQDYATALDRLRLTQPVVTDKAPLNFRHVGPVLAAMPEARVLFLRRDARATCWSNYSNSFGGPSNNFGNDMIDTARMYRLHLDFLDFWTALYPDRVTVVPYERLTEHQEDESRKLVAAAGLDWEDACLDFHKTERAVRTVSAGQVRQKMYTGSSEAWRRYAPYIGPMLEQLDGLDEA